jgi:glutamine synthetase type III
MELTDAQKAMKAKNKVEKLAIQNDLSNLKARIDKIFNDAPIAVANVCSKEELQELISEIQKGTATNEKTARFLDIASSLGI